MPPFVFFLSEAEDTGCFFKAVILDNKVGDVTVYKVERLLNRISAAGFCAGLDLGVAVARDSLLGVFTLRAHRVAGRSKLAGATLSNQWFSSAVVGHIQKNHCL